MRFDESYEKAFFGLLVTFKLRSYLYFTTVDDLKKYIRKGFLATAEEADV